MGNAIVGTPHLFSTGGAAAYQLLSKKQRDDLDAWLLHFKSNSWNCRSPNPYQFCGSRMFQKPQ